MFNDWLLAPEVFMDADGNFPEETILMDSDGRVYHARSISSDTREQFFSTIGQYGLHNIIRQIPESAEGIRVVWTPRKS